MNLFRYSICNQQQNSYRIVKSCIQTDGRTGLEAITYIESQEFKDARLAFMRKEVLKYRFRYKISSDAILCQKAPETMTILLPGSGRQNSLFLTYTVRSALGGLLH